MPVSTGEPLNNPEVAAKLEEAFKKLQAASDCKSLLRKYLTPEVFEKIKNRKTPLGASLLDVIQSGVENLDSGIGGKLFRSLIFKVNGTVLLCLSPMSDRLSFFCCKQCMLLMRMRT